MIGEPGLAKARRLTALFGTLALVLSGCAAADGDGLKESESPLNRYLSAIPAAGSRDFPINGSHDEQQAFVEEQLRQTENLTAECMTEAGWEYIPDTVSTVVGVSGPEESSPWEPDNREWVTRYGYGLIRGPGSDAEPAEPPSPPPPGPNEAYVRSLTDAEREAFELALYGTGGELNEDGQYEYHWQDAGCSGWARHEVEGDGLWESGEFRQLADAINRFWQTSVSDPGYAAIDADWAACMEEAGHGGFTKQSEGEESIWALIDAYYDDQPADGVGDDFGSVRDPAYARIAETEIPLALADLECREKTDYRQRHLRVQYALEEQFVADHAEELDAALERFGR